MPNGVIVEIGSFKGKSTVCLAKGSSAGARVEVHAIDPHVGTLEQRLSLGGGSSLDDLRRNVKTAGVDHLVVPIVMRSEVVGREWRKPISFLWIDGDHSYAAARRDFELFLPWVVEGSTIAFHDSTQGELPKLVVECFKAEGFTNVGLIDSIAYATKCHGARKTAKDLFMLSCVKNWMWFRRFRGIRAIKGPVQQALAKLSW